MNYTGVYRTKDGYYSYRFVLKYNGKEYNRKGSKDKDGKPFKSAKAAYQAREAAIMQLEEELYNQRKVVVSKTVADVFNEYCESGRNGKAYQTIRKQDSLWNIHLSEKFGSRLIDSISVAEVNDYLESLYYRDGYAYQYVGSFLKMFYLIFGQAYSRDYLSPTKYSKLCINKNTKIHMPKKRTNEDDGIVAFSDEEIKRLDEYFKGRSVETAYMIGKHCGLRINECFGLKWDNINFKEGIIEVRQQMLYEDGIIRLGSLKTIHAKRDVCMSDSLIKYLSKYHNEVLRFEKEHPQIRQQNQKTILDENGNPISSLCLVNTLPDGRIRTVNSMKFHTQKILAERGIQFRYHYLRHTYGTRLAELNTPAHILCNQMGHSKIQTTQEYYLAVSDRGLSILRDNLNTIE